MIFRYDLHMHSGLSPCADNASSPANIAAAVSARKIDIMSLTDHNAIDNMPLVIEYAKMLDVLCVPGIEVTTAEDIHVLCYFPDLESIGKFYSKLSYPPIKNRPDIFGNQYVYDEDDMPCREVERTLVAGCDMSESDLFELARSHGGIAVPAHVDRDSYGMLMTLGTIPSYYPTIEISRHADLSKYKQYVSRHNVLRSSDAHFIEQIGCMGSTIELGEKSAAALIERLWEFKK